MNKDTYVDDYINRLILTEGGFTDDTRDAGHQLRVSKGHKWDSYCTNFGITQFTLSEFLQRQASILEVTHLSRDTAKSVYLQNYFYKYKIDKVATEFQLLMLDMVVQHKYAIRLIQQTINRTGRQVKVDNIMGANTLEAINVLHNSMGGYFINMVNSVRIEYYNNLAKKNKWAIAGWLNRAEKFIVFPGAGSTIARNKLKQVREYYGVV